MNYTTIKSTFWELLGFDGDSHGGYFSDATVLKYCNMAVIDLVSHSRCLERRNTILIEAGTQQYDLPTDCERILRAAFDWEKLIPTTKLSLQQDEVYWDTRRGDPQFYYTDMTNDQIGLFYIPGTGTAYTSTSSGFGGLIASTGFGGVIDTSIGERIAPDTFGGLLYEITANGLEIFYNARPPAIVDGDDVPELPAWSHPLVIYFMLWKALSAQTVFRDLEKSSLWHDFYKRGRSRLKHRMNSRLPKDWILKTKDQGLRPRVSRLPDLIDNS